MGLLLHFIWKFGRYWPVALGWQAALAWLLERILPEQARRRRVSAPPDFFRHLHRWQVGFALLDLLGQAIQAPLRIAYPPLPSAWFAIQVPRTAISLLAAALALL